MSGALTGIQVLDFSTLLPGPLATQMMRDAGAEVVKVERPGIGDEMRGYTPRFGDSSANFAVLNRGKRSVVADLKSSEGRAALRPLIEGCDVIVEQFRPGVMARLGLDYDSVVELNPDVVYCSITGYGQTGPRAGLAAHDLNYVGDSGMLDLVGGDDPVLPHGLMADVGAGTYPAMVNILMALRQRDQTGQGCHLDIAMADNLYPFIYMVWAASHAAGEWPRRGREMLTGGSPRYQFYATADGRHLAVAALEERFWQTLCDLVGLDESWRDDAADPAGTRQALASLIATRSADEWEAHLAGADVCTTVVRTFEEAMSAARARGDRIFDIEVAPSAGRPAVPSLPMPLCPPVLAASVPETYPPLGESDLPVGAES